MKYHVDCKNNEDQPERGSPNYNPLFKVQSMLDIVDPLSPNWKAAQIQTVSCVPTEQLTNADRPVTVVNLVVALRCVLHHALNDFILLSITNSKAT